MQSDERYVRTGSRPSFGFTLIEVMVALVIVSIGMVAVIQAVSQAASNGSYLRDKSIAQWVALNQLTLIRISQSPPSTGTSTGEAEMAGERWKWKATVSEVLGTMKQIEVSVRSADSAENSQLASVTGFFGDKLGKPGTLIAQFSGGPTTAAPGSPSGEPAPRAPAPNTVPTPNPSPNPSTSPAPIPPPAPISGNRSGSIN